MEFKITKADPLKPKPDESTLGFGELFTDHMFIMDYTPEAGWHDARIEPYRPMDMDPAAMILHYGQGVFEGLKAYRTESGAIQLFRPKDNMRRMNRSCRIMCMAEFDEGLAMDALKQLLAVERDWVPSAPGTSLYIRPTMIATDPFLGVRASGSYRFFIILSPVGAYYAEGFNPINIWVTRNHVRASKGGVGEAKTPGNYAASLYAAKEANEKGYSQVMWLDGAERKYIEEVGAMNIFFVLDGELVTPELSGSILHGVTRDSVIALAKKWGVKVSERKISIDEIDQAHDEGKLNEIFGSGTAAVISPVGKIGFGEKELLVGDGKVGPFARKMYDAIQDIQYGKAEDPMGWIEPV
ncbi:Branched-chain-amino-acid aminotransferase 2 [Candidatus Desulfarcum epimagneticum]|uniref:Branched-chain-amino-acid aminotransferase n=1 Tax=uncultured Desulfobacteraceae bacterium TaxID=218296 RepID=A0A484HBX7_9BACT|nr:Branched-chain-amino-acid aminotransferase 2 [uncultured Desulfobacteraceae bacterium]